MTTISYQNVVYPIGISFKDWSAQIREGVVDYSFPVSYDEKNWRKWVSDLIDINPEKSNIPLPDEKTYPNDEDWRKWASFFIENI